MPGEPLSEIVPGPSRRGSVNAGACGAGARAQRVAERVVVAWASCQANSATSASSSATAEAESARLTARMIGHPAARASGKLDDGMGQRVPR